MEKQEKVIDASVIFKWFSQEEHSDKAIILLKEHVNQEIRLIIPDFAIIEVINALRYKKNSEEISNANKDIWGLQLKIEKINKDTLEKAITLALKNNLTIYDSIYVAISQLLSVPLITSDAELFKLPNVIPLDKI